MQTLTNAFHGTEYHTRKTPSEVQGIIDATYGARTLTPTEKRWVATVRSTLCASDCMCATSPLGER